MASGKAPEKKGLNGPGPPATRSSNTAKTPLPQEDIEAIASAVKDYDSAEQYLASTLLRQADEPLTLPHLVGILFQITQMVKPTPHPVINTIRAVAFILKQQVASQLAETVAQQITESLSPRIVNSIIAAIAPQVASILTTSKTLRDTLAQSTMLQNSISRERDEQEGELKVAAERFEEAVDMLYESIEDCNNSYKLLTPSLEFTQDRLNTLSTQLSQQPQVQSTPPNTTAPSHPTYSSIAASSIPPAAEKAVARASIRAKQILLDPTPGNSLFAPDATNASIAKEISDILAKTETEDTPPGEVRAIQRLHNGGLIIELDSENLANWLRSPVGRLALESHLDSTAYIRDRTYAIVAQYLPIALDVTREDFPRLIERDNHLPPNSIASIRWIKPPQRRSPEQCFVFALMQVKDAATANDLLKEGVCINAHRYTVHKDKKEPLRCAKCQKFGHMACNCSAPHDVCGTCGGRHWTSRCNAFRTECCANCRSQTHSSWSRKCPEFVRRCQTLDDMHPENKLPFFPTASTWTHVTHPVKPKTPTPAPLTPARSLLPPSFLANPPTHSHIAPSKQSTLNFQPIAQLSPAPMTSPSTIVTPLTPSAPNTPVAFASASTSPSDLTPTTPNLTRTPNSALSTPTPTSPASSASNYSTPSTTPPLTPLNV